MSLKDLAKKVRAEGRGKDDQLVHLTSREVAGLHQLAEAAGGKLTTNPKTGLPEAGFLDSMLPTILGFAANFIVPGSGMVVGAATGALQNKDDPLMGAVLGGMGGYGGGQLGAGLQGVGAGAAQQAAMSAVPQGTAMAAHQGAQQAAMAGLGPTNAAQLAAADASTQLISQGFGSDAAIQNLAAGQASKDFMAKPFYEQAMSGGKALMQPGGMDQFAQSMGGIGDGSGGLKALSDKWMPTAKAAGMAAAPMIYDSMIPKPMGGDEDSGPGELPKYKYAAELTGNYYQPGQGTHERNYFTQPTFRRMAGGGIAGLAKGGPVHMESGDFVIPADVTAYAGGGSTEAGMEALSKKLGAVPIRGAGDGLSDDIPATIDGKPMARVANGEMLVKQPGKEGTKKLYAALAKIRKQATGRAQQIKPVDLDKALA